MKSYKLMFSLLIVMLLSISMVSAFNFDDVLTYENEDKTAVIHNCDLWLGTCLNQGELLGKAELKSHKSVDEPREVFAGKNRSVMHYEFKNWKGGDGDLGEVYFTNVKSGKLVEKDYYFARAIYEDVVKEDKEEVCNDELYKGVLTNTCREVVVGTYIINEVVRYETIEDNKIPEGDSEIHLFTDVAQGDEIDGVWTIKGKKIKKHAVWIDSLSEGLVGYWGLDETSGTSAENIYSGLYNGTLSGTSSFNTTEAINDNSVFFNNGQITMTGSNQLGNQANMSYSMWLFPKTGCSTNYDTIVMAGQNVNGMVMDLVGATCEIRLFFVSGGGQVLTGDNVVAQTWNHIVFTHTAGGDTKVYLDGSEIVTSTGKSWTTSGSVYFGQSEAGSEYLRNSNLDEIAIYNRTLNSTEVAYLYDGGAGTFYSATIPSIMTAVLSAPEDYYNTTDPTPSLSANFTGNVVNNVTEVHYLIYNDSDSLIENITETGLELVSYNKTWTTTALTDDTYTWAVYGYGDGGLNASTGNRTFTIDTTPPEINITHPEATTYISLASSYIIGLNYTATDLHLGSCWYNNETANVSIACGTNATINITGGSHTFIVYANDTFNNENSSSVTFFLNTIAENATYDTTAVETQETTISLNLTANNITSFNSTLVYNGTARATTYNANGYSNSTFIITPVGNISFYWNYNLNGINYNSSTYYQFVTALETLNVTSGSCSGGLTNAMCWDFKAENNLTTLTADVDYNFKYGITNSSSKQVYGSFSAISNMCLCINSTIFNSYTMSRGEIQYSKTGYTDRRFYTFSVNRISNTTINNTLYSLINGDATSFLFDFANSQLTPYVSKYASLLRWYPDLNEYKVVEMAETDDKGETIMRVKVEDVDYRVALYHQNGSLIKLLNPVRFACLSSPCTYSVPISDETTDFTSIFGVEGGITYNETNKIFTLTWNDPTQNTDQMRLVVTRERGDSAYTICDTSASGFTGVLTCDSTGYTGSLKAVGYRTASPEVPLFQKIINTISSPFRGDVGLFISLIIFMLMVLIGVFSPIASVILGIVALYPAYLLGSITLPVLIAIAVLGGIVIHFAKRSG